MDVLLSTLPPPGLSTVPLRPYQMDAIAAIHTAYARGLRRQVLALPTGAGKTVVFVELIRQRGGRALILVHRDELISQTYDKLAIVGQNDVGIGKAERDEHEHQVVLASVQTVSRPNRLARLVPNFETVVVDEAHHSPAETYRRVLTAVKVFEPDGPLLLGATATPERADGTGLDEIFEEIVYRRTIPEMVAESWLSAICAPYGSDSPSISISFTSAPVTSVEATLPRAVCEAAVLLTTRLGPVFFLLIPDRRDLAMKVISAAATFPDRLARHPESP